MWHIQLLLLLFLIIYEENHNYALVTIKLTAFVCREHRSVGVSIHQPQVAGVPQNIWVPCAAATVLQHPPTPIASLTILSSDFIWLVVKGTVVRSPVPVMRAKRLSAASCGAVRQLLRQSSLSTALCGSRLAYTEPTWPNKYSLPRGFSQALFHVVHSGGAERPVGRGEGAAIWAVAYHTDASATLTTDNQ